MTGVVNAQAVDVEPQTQSCDSARALVPQTSTDIPDTHPPNLPSPSRRLPHSLKAEREMNAQKTKVHFDALGSVQCYQNESAPSRLQRRKRKCRLTKETAMGVSNVLLRVPGEWPRDLLELPLTFLSNVRVDNLIYDAS